MGEGDNPQDRGGGAILTNEEFSVPPIVQDMRGSPLCGIQIQFRFSYILAGETTLIEVQLPQKNVP